MPISRSTIPPPSIENGARSNTIPDYAALTERVRALPGGHQRRPHCLTARFWHPSPPLDRNAPVQISGISLADLKAIPLVAEPRQSLGTIEAFPQTGSPSAGNWPASWA